MSAFLLWPLALWHLGARILDHTARTLTRSHP